MRTEDIPWARFGFEGILIVSSILIALAVDSWREHRSEREDEQQVLASLLVEFQRNRTELDRSLDSMTVSLAASERIMGFAGKTLTDDDQAVIEQSLNEFFSYYTFDPSTGALDSLLSSGELDLLLNLELRGKLAGWSGLMSDYKEEEREVDFVAYRELSQFLRTVAPLPNVDAVATGFFEKRWQDAVNDIEFVNLLGAAAYSLRNTLDEAGAIGREVDSITELIESELR